MRQDYTTALDALDFDSHDHDFDLGTCLLYLFQSNAHNDPEGRKLAIQVSKQLDERDRRGLRHHFARSRDAFWSSLLGTDTGESQYRAQQMFVSSMQSQESIAGLHVEL